MKSKFLALLSGVLVCFAGCSEPDYQEVPVYPVSGKVMVEGAPAYGATIVFYPQSDVGMSKGNKAFAVVQQDGTFHATTYITHDGAPAGEYLATVIWPEDPNARGPSPDRLAGRYAKPETSQLKVVVTEGENTLPPWDL